MVLFVEADISTLTKILTPKAANMLYPYNGLGRGGGVASLLPRFAISS